MARNQDSYKVWVALALVLVTTAGCGPRDPRVQVLEERARWSVQPLEWVETADGAIRLGTRVSGPPNSKIDALTVRVDLFDVDGASLGAVWHTFDLREVPRGGPRDFTIRIPAPDSGSVSDLGLSMMLQPTAEEERHLRELQGL